MTLRIVTAILFAVSLTTGMFASQANADEPKLPTNVRLMGEFTNRYKLHNKYVVVPKGLSEEQLIALAKELNEYDSNSQFWMFDDDSQMADLLDKLPKYERTEITIADVPTRFIIDHCVGNIATYRSGRRVLHEGAQSIEVADIAPAPLRNEGK